MTIEDLYGLVVLWQERLGLEQWRIAVILEEKVFLEDRRVFAKAQSSEYFDRTTLTFDKNIVETGEFDDCIEWDLISTGAVSIEDYIEETVAHELLHLVLRNVTEVSDLVRDDLTPAQKHIWDGAWRRAEEELCERTAVALVAAFRGDE